MLTPPKTFHTHAHTDLQSREAEDERKVIWCVVLLSKLNRVPAFEKNIYEEKKLYQVNKCVVVSNENHMAGYDLIVHLKM